MVRLVNLLVYAMRISEESVIGAILVASSMNLGKFLKVRERAAREALAMLFSGESVIVEMHANSAMSLLKKASINLIG